MPDEENTFEKREDNDRRSRIFRTMLGGLVNTRRRQPQRADELEKPYYTDFYDTWLFVLVISIVLLSVTDAMFTLKILDHGGREVNPVMAALLHYGSLPFFLVKYGLTCAGLVVCLLHIKHTIFRIIPMTSVLFSMLAAYLVLIAYEISILVRMQVF